jgi:iron complex transport system substrate-binding protein
LRIPGLVCLTILAAGLARGWPAAQAADGQETAQTVIDFRGKPLSVTRPVRRVVCLIESALSGLFMLGAGDRVVGVSEQVFGGSFDWYARLDDRIRTRQLPVPGNWDFASLESIVALRPDLVIMWAAQRESIAALEERGVPVFGVFIASEADVFREMEMLGILTGRTERAHVLVEHARTEVARVAARIAHRPRPEVFYLWPGSDLETSCGPSMVNDILEHAGGHNVCVSMKTEHAVINAERFLLWDPEVLILWPSAQRRPVDVLRDRRWQTLRAVKEGAVFELPEPFLADQWTLKYQLAVKAVAKRLHPDVFGALDLAAEAKTMLRFLYGPRIEAQP